MIERDYIMRMISMLTAVIAKIFAMKRAREYPQAIKELQRQSRSLLGIDAEFLSSLDTSSLVHLFGSDPHGASTKCYVAGVLLKERSELLMLLHRPDEATADATQALSLLLEAYQIANDPIDARHLELIDELAGILDSLPDGLAQRLSAYRERSHAQTSSADDL